MIVTECPAPCLSAVGTALPPNYVDQQTLSAALRPLWARKHVNQKRFDDLQKAVGVAGRYLALPMDEYPPLDSFAKSNAAWMRIAPDLAETAITQALTRARLTPRDIDHLFLVTVTGIATPSLDARLVNRLGMRADVKRTPIFGLGCVAGTAGASRACDYVRAFPEHAAMVVSVELCSLTLQKDDISIANIIASGLFGDGAAALIVEGGARDQLKGPRVLATRSVFYPDTEQAMGWEVVDGGFKVVLSAEIPHLVSAHLRSNVDEFLADHGLARSQIRHWIAHTGGPRVLEAFEQSLELPAGALARSWESLRNTGNLSSASVLFVLKKLFDDAAARPGDYGVMLAMGPGFCAEMILLIW